MIQNEEFIQEFVDEARGHTEQIEKELVSGNLLKPGHESIHELFRAVHSVKGTAGFFGLKKIVALSHVMESVFGEVRNGRLQLDESQIDLFLLANDCLKTMIEDVLNSDTVDISVHEQAMNAILNGQETAAPVKIAAVEASPASVAPLLNEAWLEHAHQHGQRLYFIHLDQHLLPVTDESAWTAFSQRLQSVSELLGGRFEGHLLASADEALQWFDELRVAANEYMFSWICGSVLERDLLAIALGFPLEKVEAISIEQSGASQSASDELTSQVMRPLRVEDSIRVHVSILNDLLNMASEMVLGRNQLLRTLETYRKSIPGLGPILQNIDRLTSGMQEKVMQTRMQPLSNVFGKFPRMIRDLAKSLHKEIELTVEGDQVELDKSMVEALADPLTHLVRNAADHGLELPESRVRAGKPRTGAIKLRAYHEGGYVHIDISDDGAGMDVNKISSKALEKGIVSQNELQAMSEQEMLKLIFRPGFSTAEQVTNLSGRGVGMDVVRTNIEKLGGAIELFSEKGAGSTVRLLLPLTLAIIQSLIVEAGGHRFALPQVNLKEAVTVSERLPLEQVQGMDVLRLRGRLLPVIRLQTVLELGESADSAPTIPNTNRSDKLRVLVLKIGNRRFGIAVDDILGSEETLVKPLPEFLQQCLCYAGVTILGDGKTSMILDLEGILRVADIRSTESNDDAMDEEKRREQHAFEMQNLLLFHCSGVEMFALDLAMVARVEEIKPEQLERVGEREYVQYRGDSLRVIRPEQYLQVTHSDHVPSKYYVIIPKLVRHPVGLVIHRIYDNVSTRVDFNSDELRLRGIVGSTIYESKLVLMMNLYELFELAVPEWYSVQPLRAAERYRVLLAEDTPFFQKMERSYLEEAGCQVTLVSNGREALEALERETFDVVVSDIQMPLMDGFELAKRIREHKHWRELPLIAVTSMTGEGYSRQGIASGFDFYEAKLDRDRLLATIELAITQRRAGNNSDERSMSR